jgi:FlaA1/EpsC-like NDP-sugar epimerase
MENNPRSAVLNNIFALKLVAGIAMQWDVEKFIYVSSDKAVNPTNVMGASKRISEMYIQSLPGAFITTRFGNVMESNGSVIPRWKKQIANKRPLTVTHPEITRFFMSISDAADLVIEAGRIGKGGDIFIFDMGDPVKVAEIAVQMKGDLPIVYTGLRPGEKLYEEILLDTGRLEPTENSKIFTSKAERVDHEWITAKTRELIDGIYKKSNFQIVREMKNIVPEYKSKNSVYEVLDSANDDLG